MHTSRLIKPAALLLQCEVGSLVMRAASQHSFCCWDSDCSSVFAGHHHHRDGQPTGERRRTEENSGRTQPATESQAAGHPPVRPSPKISIRVPVKRSPADVQRTKLLPALFSAALRCCQPSAHPNLHLMKRPHNMAVRFAHYTSPLASFRRSFRPTHSMV